MLKTLVVLIHILICVALSAAILLQHRKSGGFSGVFGGGTMQDQSGGQWKRFTGLTKITICLMGGFMITTAVLALV